MEKIIKSAKTLVETLRKMPVLLTIPGFFELENKLVEKGILEKQPVVESPEKDSIVDMKNELAPLFWIGIFTVQDPDTGENIEMPLQYKTSGEINVISYTANLENIPSLITMCNAIEKATGSPWRMIEYQAQTEWDKTMFMTPGTTTLQ